MKTKIEISGYEIEIEENDGLITVKAEKEGEIVEEFTLEPAEGGEESEGGEDEMMPFGGEEGEEEDFGGEEGEEAGEAEGFEDEGDDDDDDEEEESNESVKLESFQSFINKAKK